MPTRTDKLKSGFFLRTPRADEPPIQYTFTELSRLLIDINSRFAKVNNNLAVISTGNGGEGSELDSRVESLESVTAELANALQTLTIRVNALEEDLSGDELQAALDAINTQLSELSNSVATVRAIIANPGAEQEVTPGTAFSAYTMQEFSFPVDFSSFPSNTKLCANVIVTDGVSLPPEIAFSGIVVDTVNNVILVRYSNNSPTNVTWPATKVTLHTFF